MRRCNIEPHDYDNDSVSHRLKASADSYSDALPQPRRMWRLHLAIKSLVVILLVIAVDFPLLHQNTWLNDEAGGYHGLNKHRLDWWQKTIIYQVYPRSFQDSDGDGVGDLPGIISKLDYIKELGIETIWLSPFYTSPMADFGYDVSNYMDVDPIFGNIKDFEELVNRAHEMDMKVVIDFIPNHTSDKHKWFIQSRKGPDNSYSDYYVWMAGKVLENGEGRPPNNWLSAFGGSAWEWDGTRKQYYLHQYLKEQPDLNYRNPRVREEIRNILEFWLSKDVDGFRIDAIYRLFEDTLFRDEPRSYREDVKWNESKYLEHRFTQHQEEIHDVMREWRTLFDEYHKKTGKRIYMVAETVAKPMDQAMKYYHSGADAAFNFNLIYINKTCGGTCIHKLVSGWLDLMPEGKWAHWVIGNHDQKRVTTKKGADHVNVMNMLNLLLPGTPTTYYGEEIGQLDIKVKYEDTQDPHGKHMGKDRYRRVSRDPCRAPMQWNDEKNAGFSTADKTWLPVHPGYKILNVAAQENTEISSLNIYRRLASLRKLPSFQHGDMEYSIITDEIFSFYRQTRREDVYLIILNLGSKSSTNNFETKLRSTTERRGEIVLNSGLVHNQALSIGSKIDLRKISLNAGEGIVIKIVHEQF